MNLGKLANSYLRQAEARLKDATEAYDAKNYPYSLRLAQECVELSVKAVLRAVGIEYPKQHEVSDLLSDVKLRFPEGFLAEIPSIQEASKSLYRKRELAFYGGEDALLSPEEAISEEDANKAVNSGKKVFSICSTLMDKLVADQS